jgi:hypothetical protein
MKYSFIFCYRDRETHLNIVAPHLRDLLDNVWQLHEQYEIIIVEQNDNKKFRRANLLNEGAKAARGDVLILHDVDYYATENVIYWTEDVDVFLPVKTVQFVYNSLQQKPLQEVPGGYRHFKDSVDDNFFGAISCFRKDAFFEVNGFSHLFTGWGCEEADLRERCITRGLKIKRGNGHFLALDHPDSGPSMQDGDFINNMSMANNWQNYTQYGINNQPSTVREITPKHPKVDRWILAKDFDGTPESHHIITSRFNWDEGRE